MRSLCVVFYHEGDVLCHVSGVLYNAFGVLSLFMKLHMRDALCRVYNVLYRAGDALCHAGHVLCRVYASILHA